MILDKDGDADDAADNDGGDGEDDADFFLGDNPNLETSNDTSNDHVSNFAETHRRLWQRVLLFITRVVWRLRLDHRRPERRDFNLGTFLGTRNRGLYVSGPLLDRSLSKPFLDQRTLFHVQDELIFVLLEHLYNARNVVAGNLYHQLLRHFSIHEMGWNNLADLGTFSINRLTQTDEWLQVHTMSNFDFVTRQRCGAPSRRCSLGPRLRLNLLSLCPDSRGKIHNFPREALRPRRSHEGLSRHHFLILRPLFAGIWARQRANKRHAPRSII